MPVAILGCEENKNTMFDITDETPMFSLLSSITTTPRLTFVDSFSEIGATLSDCDATFSELDNIIKGCRIVDQDLTWQDKFASRHDADYQMVNTVLELV